MLRACFQACELLRQQLTRHFRGGLKHEHLQNRSRHAACRLLLHHIAADATAQDLCRSDASILYPLNNGRWGITWSPRARYASPGRAYRDHTFFRSRWMPETRCSRRAPPQPKSGDMGGILVTASTVTAWSSRLQHSLTFAHPRRRRRRTHCGPVLGQVCL